MKNYFLISLLALTMTACGGGDEETATPQTASATTAPAVVPTSSDSEPNKFQTLTPAFSGVLSKSISINSATTKTTQITKSADDNSNAGVIVYVNSNYKSLENEVNNALDAGLLVVLESDGTPAGMNNMSDATILFAGVGVPAAAVVLYKSTPGDAVSVLPFSSQEMDELAEYLKTAAPRGKI